MMEPEGNQFRIDDHPLGAPMSEPVEKRIVCQMVSEYEAFRTYWMPWIEKGRDVWRKIMGEIFGAQALAEMDAEGKIPIEIAEGWPKFLAVLGMASVSQKTGVVMANYPSEAASPEAVNTALNAIKNQEGVKEIQLSAFGDGAVTGFPQFVWVDRPENKLDGQQLMVEKGAWDTTLPDVNFMRADGKDVGTVFRVLYAKKDDLLALYPTRKAQIEQAFKDISEFDAQDFGTTIADRDTIFGAIQAATSETSRTGRVHVIERHSMIRRPVQVWWSEGDGKWQALSPDWDARRVEEWKRANPDKKPLTMEGHVHWVTTITMTGQLLENRPHWFQEGRFNCEMYVPHMIDKKPVGIFEFATNNWMLSAIAKTEEVHSLRLNNGNPLVIQSDTLENPESVEYEVTKPRGKVFVKRGRDVRAAITTLESKRDNVPWRDLHAEASEVNDRMTVDRNVEGGAQSSQEAAKVFGARVAQVKNKYAMALDNWNAFNLRLDALIVRCWQIQTDSFTAMRWVDPETGNAKEAEFNVPGEYDILSGEPTTITNRLDLCKYDVVFAESDNSVSGRAAELEQFTQIMQGIVSTPPEHWGSVLSKVPNKIAKSIGDDIKQAQEQAAKNPPPMQPKVSVSIPADKAMNNPPLVEALKQVGIDVSMAQPQPAQETPQQPEQPEPMAQENGPITPQQEIE